MDFKVSLVKQPVFNVRSDNIVKIEPPQESLVVKSTETQQEIIAKDKLFNKVTVKNWNLQEKIVKPLEEEILVIPDADYDALKSVTIEPMPAQPSGEIELTKNGTYDVKQYATAVVSVGEEKDVNFYDYDGTLVASYTIEEANALTALPTAPDHSQDEVPLTFQEWNYTLEEINALDHIADVGANYITTDGKTYVYFYLNKATGLTPSVQMYLQYVSYSYNLYKLPENTLIDTYTSGIFGSKGEKRQLQNITEYGNYRLELAFTGDGISSHIQIVQADYPIISTQTETKIYYGDYWSSIRLLSSTIEKASIPNKLSSQYIYVGSIKCFVIPRLTDGVEYIYCYGCEIICTSPTMATYKPKLTVNGRTKRLVVYNNFVSISYTDIKKLYLSPLLDSVGSLSYNDYIEELKLPPSVTSAGNYAYSPTSSKIGYLKKAIFLGDVTSISGTAFGSRAYNNQGTKYLQLIDLSHCTSVPSLSSATLPDYNKALQIKVPDELYDQWIVATNWVTYAKNIIKASEYVEE